MKIDKKLTVALISDVLIDMGFENQLLSPKFRPNFEEAKAFGKVRTVKLKKMEKNDNYKDIYKCVEFIPTMSEGEILLVANGFEDMAFFGELMSTLAIKNGLAGAIIDGVTRDRAQTRELKFPVFAKGTYPKDLRNKAIVKSIDKNIFVDGVSIASGDFIFADSDAVIVIPSNILETCLDRCDIFLNNEEKVKELISKGESVDSISSECGNF